MYKNENAALAWLCLLLLIAAWAVLGVGLHLLEPDRGATANWEGYQVGWGVLVPRLFYLASALSVLVLVALALLRRLPLLLVLAGALVGLGFSTLMWLDDTLPAVFHGFEAYPPVAFWLSLAVIGVSFVGFLVAAVQREDAAVAREPHDSAQP